MALTMASSLTMPSNIDHSNAGSIRSTTEEITMASRDDLKKTAMLIVEDSYKDSILFDADLEAKIPVFNLNEMQLGRILGRGGFCVVTEIEKVTLDEEEDDEKSPQASGSFLSRLKKPKTNDLVRTTSLADEKKSVNSEGRSINSEHRREFSISTSRLSRKRIEKFSKKKAGRKGGRFALKKVAYDLAGVSRVAYLKGLVDLVIEAKFLSAIDHPNIVRLCGISTEGLSDFIVVERLRETLSMRFRTWTKIDRQCKGITGVFTGSKSKKTLLYEDRIKAAHDIACAMDYLHYRNVIFRDLVSGL